jgi:uncharacterized protein YecT (DUF1311 family)
LEAFCITHTVHSRFVIPTGAKRSGGTCFSSQAECPVLALFWLWQVFRKLDERKAEHLKFQSITFAMEQTRPLLLLLIVFLPFVPLRPQQMNERDSPCAGVVVTSDLVACLSKAQTSSEAEMKAVHEAVRKNLAGNEVQQLARTQKLWAHYREANCSAERSLYAPGTAAPPVYLACMGAMARERTKELRVTYKVRLK